jgi:hypothetical protein
MRKTMVVLMSLCVASLTRAELLSYESFSGYTVGTQIDESLPSPAVAGYTGDWTRIDWGDQQAIIQPGSLIYGAARGDSIGVPSIAGVEITQPYSGRVYRLLDSTLTVTDATTGTRYLSWLFKSGQETGATTYQMLDLYNSNTADANRNFTAGLTQNGGLSGTQYNFGVNEVYTSTGVAADTAVHLFVVRFNLSAAAGADSVTVWIDPVSEASPGTTVSGKTIKFDRLSVSDYDGNSAMWDEIRWGTAFNDVLPDFMYTAPKNAAASVSVDQDLSWMINNATIRKIDLYFGPENDPNLTSNPAYKKLSQAPAATLAYDPGTLLNDKTYYWRVDAYEPNTAPGATDLFLVPGPVWSFKTVAANASISAVTPALTVVDAGSNAVLTVTGTSVTAYQWFKIGTPDTQLTNGADYDGVTTNTLTIKDVQLADEGYYYCVGSNNLPSSASNRDSGPGRVMTRRLTSHYTLEAVTSNIISDAIDGYDMTLASDDAGTDLPVLTAGVPELGGNGLLFNNTSSADPNTWAQYAALKPGAANYDDITISLWAYWNGGGIWQRLFDFGNNTTQYMFLSPNAAGTNLRFAITTTGAEQIVQTAMLPTGQWTHIAVTLSGNTARLYVNGALAASNASVTLNPRDVAATRNYIGKSQFVDPYFNGLMDDIRIYNYARTTEQIAQDYLGVKGDWVCNNELNNLAYDFDNNCQVDLADFAMFASEWLDSFRIYPVQ